MTSTSAAASQGPGGLLGGRYLPLRELKRESGVRTLAAEDIRDGSEVVIKMVGAGGLPAAARMRLEYESRVLRQLDSPRLASVLDVVVDEDALLLVMPLAPGESLDRRLAAAPISPEGAVTIGIELLRALEEAHSCGVVHRDVKPANVVIEGLLPAIRLTLIDFGLARTSWSDHALTELPVGTARYVSPEQAGLLHHEVDERADLYSAGAVLFECVAGRPPFEGDSVADVLRAHATVRPPQLRSLRVGVPAALDEIVQRLLRKDPRDRYQTAAGAIADLERLAAGLAAGDSMLLSGSRSVLAAPIHLRGRAVACLYLTHDDVGGLYDDDDERVAAFIVAIAGAALENAEGFAEVHALTKSLEQRVQTRTEELADANRELDRSLAELRLALTRETEVAERLRELDQLKNEFVAMVAHDLRTPMATIAGAAATLAEREELGADDRDRLLSMIYRNTMASVVWWRTCSRSRGSSPGSSPTT